MPPSAGSVQKCRTLGDDGVTAIHFAQVLDELAKKNKKIEDISEVFLKNYIRLRGLVGAYSGTTKVWNQTAIYGNTLHGAAGVCWALSHLWIRCHKHGSVKDLYVNDPALREELQFLREVQVAGKKGNPMAMTLAYMRSHKLVPKNPYIARTEYELVPRGILTLADGIGVSTVGDGLYSVLSFDGEGSGHAVVTLLYPGGVSIFFDPNIGEVKFQSSFYLKLFLLKWLPIEYPWAKTATVDRYFT
ncbi:YopT-type cysteine protease domain-containing protein [Archangium lansingense]|uniref:YopT-type cysteine protease domain-containing protein n=1 Tax=Archangium lansingense TaxID=2995310 RepID=A0ABT4A5Z5_9BACT|nr:YopT-type cysteine protease domain-containing protein [Archangium lansinium]MCY1077072.1 YopT-type cysteine protease domain-containing protein [Archangium lansinium]